MDRRELRKEEKALAAAHIERSIQKELIERLKSKAYGDAPLNVNEDVWRAVLDSERNKEKIKEGGVELEDEESEEEEELDVEYVEADDDDEDEEYGRRDFVSDDSALGSDEDVESLGKAGDEDDSSSEDEEEKPTKAGTKRKAKPPKRPTKRPKKGEYLILGVVYTILT